MARTAVRLPLALTIVGLLFASELSAQQPAPVASERRTATAGGRAPSRTRRFAADSSWVRVWSRGGEREAELLVEPRQLATSGQLAVVLDLGSREIVAFDVRTGATRFTLQARGEGPGEFRRPAQLAATADGFFVLDLATARVSAFDESGRFRWDAPVFDAHAIEGFCVYREAMLLAKAGGTRDALILTDSAGRSRGRRSLPWPDPGLGDFATSGMMAGPGRAGHCVFVPRYGAEWAVIPVNGPAVLRPFVTRHADAVVKRRERTLERGVRTRVMEQHQEVSTRPGASDAFMRGDTLIVRGGSDEPDGLLLLDYYLVPSGRYIHSRRLPRLFNGVTITSGGDFVGTIIGDTWSAVVALRPAVGPPAPARR